ncbi:flavin reductase family protein [Agromyces aerolatus]|uniref:flavin reductase family protein n=1 Tax=Agromyces sp. LY-1074 TaxID=3074080 RepID=UPI00285CE41B|nr:MULTISPECIES: flavin reductase family protein [unclassified Agromyces]MDR5701611.1 flavin reductase family protein [Agromyces sp. LY-1074]MDR5706141.1 flavin reductase family protein [Agromyces sp. LY-1358]
MTMTDAGAPPLIQDEFRMAMGNVATPVSIVTAHEHDAPHGTTVSAFASLSMTPPMILVSLDRRSELLEIVRRTGWFGVNVLSAHQADTAMRFASKAVDRFAEVAWSLDAGVPRIHGAASWVACEVQSFVDGGDHEVVMGTVVRADHHELAPLTYHNRRFGTHSTHE